MNHEAQIQDYHTKLSTSISATATANDNIKYLQGKVTTHKDKIKDHAKIDECLHDYIAAT